MRIILLLLLTTFITELSAQNIKQTLRGKVTNESGIGLAKVNISIESVQIKVQTSDVGKFEINDLPIGRYSVQFSADGFETQLLTEVLVEAGKQKVVEISLKSNSLQLGDVVADIPPAPPTAGSGFDVLLWSLKFRWFAWNNSPKVTVKPEIKLYLLYYNPATSPKLAHSTALNKGRIGRVNLFGDGAYSKQNLVIVAHELLHTLTASDKYDLSTGLPIYPDGYAEPDKQPRYPQDYAELMGGYVPMNETRNTIPKNLNQTLIGTKTAREIGWLK